MEGLTGQIKVEFCWNPSSRYWRDSIQFLSMEGKCLLTVSIHFFPLIKKLWALQVLLENWVTHPSVAFLFQHSALSWQCLNWKVSTSVIRGSVTCWDIHTDILTTIKAHFSILYKLVIMTPSMIAWLAQLLPYGRNCDYFLEYCNYLKQTF